MSQYLFLVNGESPLECGVMINEAALARKKRFVSAMQHMLPSFDKRFIGIAKTRRGNVVTTAYSNVRVVRNQFSNNGKVREGQIIRNLDQYLEMHLDGAQKYSVLSDERTRDGNSLPYNSIVVYSPHNIPQEALGIITKLAERREMNIADFRENPELPAPYGAGVRLK